MLKTKFNIKIFHSSILIDFVSYPTINYLVIILNSLFKYLFNNNYNHNKKTFYTNKMHKSIEINKFLLIYEIPDNFFQNKTKLHQN